MTDKQAAPEPEIQGDGSDEPDAEGHGVKFHAPEKGWRLPEPEELTSPATDEPDAEGHGVKFHAPEKGWRLPEPEKGIRNP